MKLDYAHQHTDELRIDAFRHDRKVAGPATQGAMSFVVVWHSHPLPQSDYCMYKQYQRVIEDASGLIQKYQAGMCGNRLHTQTGGLMLQRCVSVAASLALLSACATTDDLRSRAPVVAGRTHLPVTDFVGCVQERWINVGADRVNQISSSNRSSLTSAGPSGIELLLDVFPSSSDATFRLYSRMVFGEGKFVSAIKACE